MALFAADLIHQKEIRDRVGSLKAQYPEDISHIDYSYGEDWTGDPSIFFEVHMTPLGSVPERFKQFTRKFPIELLTQVRSEELGLHSYIHYRDAPESA